MRIIDIAYDQIAQPVQEIQIMGENQYHLRIFCFFSLGVWSFFTPAIVFWMAVEDILAGTLWSSTVVLVVFSIPDIIAKALSPYVVNRISFRCAFVVHTLLFVGSYVLLVVIDDVRIRMVGVGVLAVGNGFGNIACVRMLAYYEHAHVHANAFQNGNNNAIMGTSLVYTGLTTWMCLTPRTVLAICIPLCFLPLVFYLLIDKEPLKDHLNKKTRRPSVQYTALNDDDHSTDDEEPTPISEQNSRIWFIFKAFPPLGYAYVTNFCTHFLMTSVVTTLTFKSSPFPPRDHYQYYRLINNIAIAIGGSVSLVFSCLDSKWSESFRIRKKMWVLALLEVIHVFIFVLASWYRFLPNVYVVLVMCFTLGIIHGLSLVNCTTNSASLFSNPRDNGTAMGLMGLSHSVSRIAAALLGLSTEQLLREHCTDRLMLGRFCLARPASHAEWSTNFSCKTRNTWREKF